MHFREGRKARGNMILVPGGLTSHHVIPPDNVRKSRSKLKGKMLSDFMGDREAGRPCPPTSIQTEQQQKSNKPKMSIVLYCDGDAASLIKYTTTAAY